MKKALLVLCCLLTVFAFSSVFAEDAKIEAGDLGFSFYTGFPGFGEMSVGGSETFYRYAGIGVVYHPAAFLSIEPGVFFMKKNREYENKMTGNMDEDDYLFVGVSVGLFYNRNISGGLYLYAGPRCDVGRYENDEKNYDGSKAETREMDISLSAIVGLKYLINDHLAVFGDFGFGYYSTNRKYEEWSTMGVTASKTETRNESFALSRGALGVVFYL